MNKYLKKGTILLMTGILSASVLAGCGTTNTGSSSSSSTQSTTSSRSTASGGSSTSNRNTASGNRTDSSKSMILKAGPAPDAGPAALETSVKCIDREPHSLL
ncbi:MAG TPA: hypothetical protein IAB31_02600 [Candidatus Choladousia intestinavium]|uniref:Uncharacterized protein n=1 Tax=Candidatus Choladousia intestinavium TaxID=2840727 RepID=A0A9D1AAR0_9FIRM|nr:hypothetical protein [Candidatus Choladousia intestinavium]